MLKVIDAESLIVIFSGTSVLCSTCADSFNINNNIDDSRIVYKWYMSEEIQTHTHTHTLTKNLFLGIWALRIQHFVLSLLLFMPLPPSPRGMLRLRIIPMTLLCFTFIIPSDVKVYRFLFYPLPTSKLNLKLQRISSYYETVKKKIHKMLLPYQLLEMVAHQCVSIFMDPGSWGCCSNFQGVHALHPLKLVMNPNNYFKDTASINYAFKQYQASFMHTLHWTASC